MGKYTIENDRRILRNVERNEYQEMRGTERYIIIQLQNRKGLKAQKCKYGTFLGIYLLGNRQLDLYGLKAICLKCKKFKCAYGSIYNIFFIIISDGRTRTNT